MTVLSRTTVAALVAAGTVLAAAPSQAGNLTPYITKYHKPYYGPGPGVIAAGVVGGLALGAVAASAAAPRVIAPAYAGECYLVRRRFVDADGYVFTRRMQVCE